MDDEDLNPGSGRGAKGQGARRARNGSMPEERDGRSKFYGRLARGAPLAVLVAAALLMVYRLLPVLKLVAVAMLVAVVLRAIARGLRKLGLPSWTVPIALLAVIGVFGALLWLVVIPNVLREVQILVFNAPRYANDLEKLVRGLPFGPDLSQLTDRLTSLVSRLTNSLPSLVRGAATAAAAAVAVAFLALYMSLDPGPLVSGALRLVPADRRGEARELLRTIEVRLRGWIAGTAIVSLFVGGGGGLGLWILGIPLPLTFGLTASVLNVVPYLGSTVGALLPSLVALAVGGWTKALEVVALFVILNQVEGNLLQPLVMGREVQLHPATIIVSFLILGTLVRVVGALLAVPAGVVFSTLMEELLPKEPP